MSYLETVLTFAGGGALFKIIDYLIEWAKERRTQRAEEVANQKDRPCFRVEVSKSETAHTNVPAVAVKIFSLGGLPVTINQGEIFIKTGKNPEGVEKKNFSKVEITSVTPVEFKITLPEKLVNVPGVREKSITVVVDFSYGPDNKQRYREEIEKEIPNWY